MKAIIDGLRYDTDKAEHIASDSYSYPSDFNHWQEDLYRTPNGRWFLVGSGGPNTKYAVSVGNGSRSGSSNNIIPLTKQEAYDWLEQANKTVQLEEYFAEKIQDA